MNALTWECEKCGRRSPASSKICSHCRHQPAESSGITNNLQAATRPTDQVKTSHGCREPSAPATSGKPAEPQMQSPASRVSKTDFMHPATRFLIAVLALIFLTLGGILMIVKALPGKEIHAFVLGVVFLVLSFGLLYWAAKGVLNPLPTGAAESKHSLGKQLLGLAVISGILLFFGGLMSVLPIMMGFLVFTDAWIARISKKSNTSGFFNVSPMAWGIGVACVFLIAYPLYLLKRNQLKETGGSTALWVTVIVLGSIVMLLSLAWLAIILLASVF